MYLEKCMLKRLRNHPISFWNRWPVREPVLQWVSATSLYYSCSWSRGRRDDVITEIAHLRCSLTANTVCYVKSVSALIDWFPYSHSCWIQITSSTAQLGFNADKISNKRNPFGMYSAISAHRFVSIPKHSHLSKIRHLERTLAEVSVQEKCITR